jgi:hypothetical protein
MGRGVLAAHASRCKPASIDKTATLPLVVQWEAGCQRFSLPELVTDSARGVRG